MNCQTRERPVQEHRPVPEKFVAPDVNVYETRDAYVVEAELPGVQKSGVNVTIDGNTLTIVGHRTAVPSVGRPLHRETIGSDFQRSFELDPVIDTSRIRAEVEQGLLTLHLPKAEKVKPRRITVTQRPDDAKNLGERRRLQG
jgi:HSP20 family protein